MQRQHLLLKALFLAILDQLTDRLLGAATPEVVDNMQNPIFFCLGGQSLAFDLSMNSETKALGWKKQPLK